MDLGVGRRIVRTSSIGQTDLILRTTMNSIVTADPIGERTTTPQTRRRLTTRFRFGTRHLK